MLQARYLRTFLVMFIGIAVGFAPTNAHAALRHTSNLAVTNISASAGDRSATVSWTEPAGRVVTGYTVVANRAVYDAVLKHNVRQSTAPITITNPLQTTATLTGLVNGSWYDFTITAYNSTEWTAINTNNVKNGGMVKPSGMPEAVSTIQLVKGNKRITVKWNRPNNGGDTQTFTVAAYQNGSVVGTRSAIKDNHLFPAVTFTGLTNGLTYSFIVTATNKNGSVISDMSLGATPGP